MRLLHLTTILAAALTCLVACDDAALEQTAFDTCDASCGPVPGTSCARRDELEACIITECDAGLVDANLDFADGCERAEATATNLGTFQIAGDGGPGAATTLAGAAVATVSVSDTLAHEGDYVGVVVEIAPIYYEFDYETNAEGTSHIDFDRIDQFASTYRLAVTGPAGCPAVNDPNHDPEGRTSRFLVMTDRAGAYDGFSATIRVEVDAYYGSPRPYRLSAKAVDTGYTDAYPKLVCR